MSDRAIDRRQFLAGMTAAAGTALLRPAMRTIAAPPVKRTAVDQVTLGKTGIKLSRLGLGTGSRGGRVQRELGVDAFTRLLRYAYDKGITYIDTAGNYRMHTTIGKAIKGLPREKLYIQSKIWGTPDKPLATLDQYRKELGTDYIDTVLVHCVVSGKWDTERKKVTDALEEAKRKKIIRAHGFSAHSIPAVARAVELDWVDVGLVRINPQGECIDTPKEEGRMHSSNASHVQPAVAQIRRLHEKRRGVIGMKLIGDGKFTDPADREKAIRFAMKSGVLDAVVIGFKSTAEIDEAIQRINAALAAVS